MSDEARMRVLLVSDDPGAEETLRPQLEGLAEGRALELKIVAPIRPGDVDDSIAGAGDRAEATAAEGDASEGVARTQVEVGDADQLLAIGDALATFEADRIVLVDPDEDLLAEAAEKYTIPVEEFNSAK